MLSLLGRLGAICVRVSGLVVSYGRKTTLGVKPTQMQMLTSRLIAIIGNIADDRFGCAQDSVTHSLAEKKKKEHVLNVISRLYVFSI